MKLVEGISEENSIRFTTNLYTSSKAIKEDDKNILELTMRPGKRLNEDSFKKKMHSIIICVIIMILFNLLKVYIPNFIVNIIYFLTNIYSLLTVIMSVYLIKYIAEKYYNNDIEDLKNHSVEHKIYKYFQKYSMPPKNIRKLQNISRFTFDCGTIIIGGFIELGIVMGIYNIIVGANIGVLNIIGIYYILSAFKITIIGFLIQILFTSTPRVKNFEIGLLAIKVLYDFEEIFCIYDFLENEECIYEYMKLNDIQEFLVKIEYNKKVLEYNFNLN